MICSPSVKPLFALGKEAPASPSTSKNNWFEAIYKFPLIQFESLYGRVFEVPNLQTRIRENLAAPFLQKKTLILEMIQSIYFDQVKNDLSALVLTLSINEKDQLLSEAALIGLERDNNEIFRRVATLIPSLDCESLARFKKVEVASMINLAERLALLTAHIKDIPDAKPLETSETSLLDFFQKLLNTIKITFSLLETGKAPDSYFEGAYMLDIFCKLVLVPIAIFSFLNVFLPTIAAAGIVVAAIIAIYAIANFVPQPISLPEFCVNLSQLAKEGKVKPITGREEITRKLTNAIISGAHSKPILTGESGMGKTSIAINLACTLKDWEVILVNTAALVPPEGSDFKLKKPRVKLMDAIRDRPRTIVFFDEIQAALTLKEGALAEEFKNDMPRYYFGASTATDYQGKIVKEEGLRTRFGYRLEVDNLTEADTCQILKEYAEKEAPEFEFKNDVFEKIYQAERKGPNPYKARDLLGRLIVELREKHKLGEPAQVLKEMRKEKERERPQPERLTLDYLFSPEANVSQAIFQARNRNHLEQQQAQNAKDIQLEQFKRLKILRNELEKQTRQLARDLAVRDVNPASEKIQQFLWNLFYMQPQLEQRIGEMKRENRLNNIFDYKSVEPFLKLFT